MPCGIPRLLRLFKKYDMPTSFFIPGHSLETFPKEMRMIVDAGHEIGAHGYLHENPVAMTPTQEEDVLVRVHSECLTGDVFGSMRCDCGIQLDAALERIQACADLAKDVAEVVTKALA